MTSFSLIDHFLLSDQLYHNCVSNVCVAHEVDNCSDHDPVLLHLGIHVNRVSYTKRQHTAHHSWARALDTYIDSYKCALQTMLKDISIPYSALQCQDVFCSDNEHITSLDRYVAQLTEACLKSAEATVPFTRPCGESGRIPGWSEFVAPLRTQSIFWHNIWSECGKPHDGVIADIMRRARARYHAAIRQVRRDKTEIVNNRIAAALSDNRD